MQYLSRVWKSERYNNFLSVRKKPNAHIHNLIHIISAVYEHQTRTDHSTSLNEVKDGRRGEKIFIRHSYLTTETIFEQRQVTLPLHYTANIVITCEAPWQPSNPYAMWLIVTKTGRRESKLLKVFKNIHNNSIQHLLISHLYGSWCGLAYGKDCVHSWKKHTCW